MESQALSEPVDCVLGTVSLVSDSIGLGIIVAQLLLLMLLLFMLLLLLVMMIMMMMMMQPNVAAYVAALATRHPLRGWIFLKDFSYSSIPTFQCGKSIL